MKGWEVTPQKAGAAQFPTIIILVFVCNFKKHGKACVQGMYCVYIIMCAEKDISIMEVKLEKLGIHEMPSFGSVDGVFEVCSFL